MLMGSITRHIRGGDWKYGFKIHFLTIGMKYGFKIHLWAIEHETRYMLYKVIINENYALSRNDMNKKLNHRYLLQIRLITAFAILSMTVSNSYAMSNGNNHDNQGKP